MAISSPGVKSFLRKMIVKQMVRMLPNLANLKPHVTNLAELRQDDTCEVADRATINDILNMKKFPEGPKVVPLVNNMLTDEWDKPLKDGDKALYPVRRRRVKYLAFVEASLRVDRSPAVPHMGMITDRRDCSCMNTGAPESDPTFGFVLSDRTGHLQARL